jgi:alginate O-acetyltransferase complex protein AlgI
MLFNSYEFLFVFLPVSLAVYYLLGARNRYWGAILWLVIASLVFYGWWNPAYLILILSSVVFNFLLGQAVSPESDRHGDRRRLGLLVFGISANIGAIAYFKYANFFVDSANGLIGSSFHLDRIVLPLAISFFTFQQITYLVDTYKGDGRERSFLRYCLFVTFSRN